MVEAVAIIMAVGLLLPLLTSVVQQPKWSKRTRTVLSVAVSLVAGVVSYVTASGMNIVPEQPSTIVVFIVGVVLASATAYKTIWQPTGTAPAIEAATSPKAEVAEVPQTETQAVSTETHDVPNDPYNV